MVTSQVCPRVPKKLIAEIQTWQESHLAFNMTPIYLRQTEKGFTVKFSKGNAKKNLDERGSALVFGTSEN